MIHDAHDNPGPPDVARSLTETLKDSELRSVASDVAELSLDSLLDPGILKDLPVVGTMHSLWKTAKTVRDYLFLKKLLTFLRPLAEVPPARRREMISRLETDPRFGARVGENVMVLLERLDAMEKATLIGRAFKAYCEGSIDAEMLHRINFAIDRILMVDLLRLAEYRVKGHIGDITTQAFVNAGLAYIPDGKASVSIDPAEAICDAMLRHVLR